MERRHLEGNAFCRQDDGVPTLKSLFRAQICLDILQNFCVDCINFFVKKCALIAPIFKSKSALCVRRFDNVILCILSDTNKSCFALTSIELFARPLSSTKPLEIHNLRVIFVQVMNYSA